VLSIRQWLACRLTDERHGIIELRQFAEIAGLNPSTVSEVKIAASSSNR
jgi:hypothetical protein